MQIMGILQMPVFLGPDFSPFGPRLLGSWKTSNGAASKQESTNGNRKMAKQKMKSKQKES
jgi:hypothetical protein